MKENTLKITVRMIAADKKILDELSINSGQSINKTLIDCIKKTTEKDELKAELARVKESLNLMATGIEQLNENSLKQAKAISAMVEVFRAKGLL